MADERPTDDQTRGGEDVITEQQQKTKRPRMWRVLLHNDDYTSMEFVIHVLETHFQKTRAEATHIMLRVHHKGTGVAGVYTRDLAETKVSHVHRDAREQGMPLRLTMEPE